MPRNYKRATRDDIPLVILEEAARRAHRSQCSVFNGNRVVAGPRFEGKHRLGDINRMAVVLCDLLDWLHIPLEELLLCIDYTKFDPPIQMPVLDAPDTKSSKAVTRVTRPKKAAKPKPIPEEAKSETPGTERRTSDVHHRRAELPIRRRSTTQQPAARLGRRPRGSSRDHLGDGR